MWCVYLLRCADKSLYCGITNTIKKRLRMHNGELKGGAKYTQTRRPVYLETYVYVATKNEALKLEIQVKKKPANKKISFLNQFQSSYDIPPHDVLINRENTAMNTLTLTFPPLKAGDFCELFFLTKNEEHIEKTFYQEHATCEDLHQALNLTVGTVIYENVTQHTSKTSKNESINNKNTENSENTENKALFSVESIQLHPNSIYPVVLLKCISSNFFKPLKSHKNNHIEKYTIDCNIQKEAYSLAIITLSDKGFHGKREDKSGPALLSLVGDMRINNQEAFNVKNLYILPDEIHALRGLVTFLAYTQGFDCIITTGGTGLSARDITPDALLPLLQSRLHGFEQAMMTKSLEKTPHAILSRAFAGIIHKSLLIAVPGSVKAATENIEAILPALPHALAKLTGDMSDCAN